MEAPTTKQIRNWSKLDFEGYDYEEPAGEAEDPLDIIVARSRDYVSIVTGRTFGPNDTTIPMLLETTAGEAIQRRTEQLVVKSQEDEAETAGDMDMIQSFSAGSYSESRVDQTKQPGKGELKLNAWPHLNKLLNMLLNEAQREYWEAVLNGVHAPYMSVTEVDWQRGDVLEQAGEMIDPFFGIGA